MADICRLFFAVGIPMVIFRRDIFLATTLRQSAAAMFYRCGSVSDKVSLFLALLIVFFLDFVIEGNQALSDRDILDSMFSHRSGVFRNCSNISDQMKRQMARTNPDITFEQTSALIATVVNQN